MPGLQDRAYDLHRDHPTSATGSAVTAPGLIMKSQLRGAGSRPIALVEAWASPCPHRVFRAANISENSAKPGLLVVLKEHSWTVRPSAQCLQPGAGSQQLIQSP